MSFKYIAKLHVVKTQDLEAAPIGGPLFAHHNCEGLRKVSRLPLGTYATRLLAQALMIHPDLLVAGVHEHVGVGTRFESATPPGLELRVEGAS